MDGIELTGLEELIKKVNDLGQRGEIIKRRAINRATNIIKDSMKSKAPRSDSNKPHLADNIIIKISDDNTAYVGPDDNFDYAKYTNYGTSKIKAQHWLEKSVLENKAEINRVIKEELERGLGL
jgi:HK97 gp10 family phage protein